MKVFIGYDQREYLAWQICDRSIHKHAGNITTQPLDATHPYYNRPFYFRGNQRFDSQDHKPFSTDFAFARFLVPIIQHYEGWAMFVDCDFLFLTDIHQLFDLADSSKAVMVVKHNYKPQNKLKMDDVQQTIYSRKCWSSLMLFNCGHPANRALTAQVVNEATGTRLHNFFWLKDEEIGALPESWNYLVGHSNGVQPNAVHFTQGGPWLDKYRKVEYADRWLKEEDLWRRG